MGFSTI